MLYFAYGSNLLFHRLYKRTPSVKRQGIGFATHHQLRFHKIGTDGSAKCDAFYTGKTQDTIHGCLYHLNERDKTTLDHIEGVGQGYEHKHLEVFTEAGTVPAFTYVVHPNYINEDLQPFEWYKNFVLAGAKQNKFPASYAAEIGRVMAMRDHNATRAEKNRSILELTPNVEALL